jgi:hypothetical protein
MSCIIVCLTNRNCGTYPIFMKITFFLRTIFGNQIHIDIIQLQHGKNRDRHRERFFAFRASSKNSDNTVFVSHFPDWEIRQHGIAL